MNNELTELIFVFKVAKRKTLFTKPCIVYHLEKAFYGCGKQLNHTAG